MVARATGTWRPGGGGGGATPPPKVLGAWDRSGAPIVAMVNLCIGSQDSVSLS